MLKNKNHCTACGSCANICPKNAIRMKEDEYGFLYPSIDEEKCINCRLCEKVCQNIDALSKNSPSKTLALQSKDHTLSQKSSSGGMFAQIAKYVLSKNGIVFGCAMEKNQDNFEIKHIYIDNEKDLYKLQGSKYVQSDIKNTYRETKQFLEQNRLVLYSGTPCQIAGLKSFLQKEYSNLVELIQQNINSIKILADEKDIKINFEQENNIPTIPINVESMDRVIRNLLSNAIKYSLNGKDILVKIKQSDDKNFVEFSVKDNGIGIAKEHLEKIFDRFYRVENATHTIKGTGLGLHLVKMTVEKHHHGKITVTSKENEGSVFTVYLPVKIDESELA